MTTNIFNTQNQKKAPPIDPYNPFENEMEFTDYNQDYTEIVPQIAQPGCRIPLYPNKREKRSIKKYYNIAGVILLLFALISNFLPMLLESAVFMFLRQSDASAGIDTSTAYYSESLLEYISSGSSIEMGILILVHLIFNVGIALIGLRLIKLKPTELFQTTSLRTYDMISYVIIGLMLQMVMSMLMSALEELFADNGVDIVTVDYISNGNAKSVVLDIIYCCLIAPVTEELLFRGFAMKAFGRVSQRFAILMSAFIFGLVHLNLFQFATAFVLGIFMGYVDIKHNSIMPSIIMHIVMNTMAQIINYSSLAGGTAGNVLEYFLSIVIYGVIVVGVIMLILFLRKNKLPYNTPHQSVRSNGIVLRSPFLVVLIVLEISLIVISNINNNI